MGDLVYYSEGGRLAVAAIDSEGALRALGHSETLPLLISGVVPHEGVVFATTTRWTQGGLLLVFDVEVATAPRLRAEIHTRGRTSAATIDGRYLYVSEWGYGLEVFDIAVPFRPRRVAAIGEPVGAGAMAVIPGRMVIVARRGGLHFFDIRDPAAAHVEFTYDGDGYFTALAAGGDYVYVITQPSYSHLRRLSVLHVADGGGRARLVGGVGVPADVHDVVVADGYLFAIGFTWMQIFDLGEPGRPSPLGRLEGRLGWGRMAVGGQHAAVAGSHRSGALVVDVTDLERPRLAGSLLGPGGGVDVVAQGSQAWILAGDEVWSARLEEGSAAEVADPFYAPGAERLAHTADSTLVVVGWRDVLLADTRDQRVDPVLSRYDAGDAHDKAVAVVDDTMWLLTATSACFQWYLEAVDISERLAPRVVGRLGLPRQGRSVLIRDGYAFVTTVDCEEPKDSALLTVDVRDLGTLEIVSSIPLAYDALGSTVVGSHLLLAAGKAGVVIVDVAAPAAPQVVSTVSLPGEAIDIVANDRVAFVALRGAGLGLVDLGALDEPRVVGIYTVGDPFAWRKNLFLHGRWLLVAGGSSGTLLYDTAQFGGASGRIVGRGRGFPPAGLRRAPRSGPGRVPGHGGDRGLAQLGGGAREGRSRPLLTGRSSFDSAMMVRHSGPADRRPVPE